MAAQLLLEEALGHEGHRHRQVIFQPELEVRQSSQARPRPPRPRPPGSASPSADQNPCSGRPLSRRVIPSAGAARRDVRARERAAWVKMGGWIFPSCRRSRPCWPSRSRTSRTAR
jgi:hypothetical protein